MWSDYEILFIAIILTVCYNDSRWDKKADRAACFLGLEIRRAFTTRDFHYKTLSL